MDFIIEIWHKLTTSDPCGYHLQPVKEWPADIMQTYGFSIIIFAFSTSCVMFAICSSAMWLATGIKPFGRRLSVQRHSDEFHTLEDGKTLQDGQAPSKANDRVRIALHDRCFTVTQLLFGTALFTQSGCESIDGYRGTLTMRAPTMLVYLVGITFLVVVEYFDVDLIGRLPKVLRADEPEDSKRELDTGDRLFSEK